MSVNKTILVGNLGADPEVRYTASGVAVANMNVATSDTWRDKSSGEMQERTEWHRVVFFARQAEVAGEYLHKGSKVYVEGRNQTRKWQNKEGQDVYTTEIIGRDLQMLDSKGAGSSPDGGRQPARKQAAPTSASASTPASGGPAAPGTPDAAVNGGIDDDFDDIPFIHCNSIF